MVRACIGRGGVVAYVFHFDCWVGFWLGGLGKRRCGLFGVCLRDDAMPFAGCVDSRRSAMVCAGFNMRIGG